MLLGASLLGMLAWRLRVPYAVALVLAGLLVVLLPPLLFDAAFRLDERELQSVARAVLFLAVPGTLVTALVVAVVLVFALNLSFAVALLFGSIVAATDPVAVVGVFRNVGAPTRLAVIAEGESLINDGVAITLYTVTIGLVTAGAPPGGGALGP